MHNQFGAGYPPARPAPPIPAPPTDHIRESLLSALQDKLKMRLRENLGNFFLYLYTLFQVQKQRKWRLLVKLSGICKLDRQKFAKLFKTWNQQMLI